VRGDAVNSHHVVERSIRGLTRLDERISGWSHSLGAGLSVVGLVVLLLLATHKGGAWLVTSVAIYGTALVLLYSASTIYHLLADGRAKDFFEHLDHTAIFLLIAGTYTPFTLITMRGPVGYGIAAAVWLFALGGITFKLVSQRHFARSATIIYLCTGWLIVFGFGKLIQSLPPGGLALLLGGGLVYTAGIAFYLWERLPFNHTIWHGFVLAGSALHFCAVAFYVVPGA
jgi:hemolysin III